MHRLEFGKRPLAPAFTGSEADTAQMLLHLLADGQHRIETGQRFLRNEGDIAAEQVAAALRRHRHKVVSVEFERSPGDGKTARQELRDGAADHRLTGTGLTDQPEDLARFQGEIQIGQDGERFRATEGFNAQVLCG